MSNKTYPPPVKLDRLMAEMLNMACPNGGENKFVFESHCIMWTIEAVKINGEWIVKMATAEPC